MAYLFITTNNCVVSRFVLYKGKKNATQCLVPNAVWFINLGGKREISNFLLVHRYVIASLPQYPDPVTLSPRVFTPLLERAGVIHTPPFPNRPWSAVDTRHFTVNDDAIWFGRLEKIHDSVLHEKVKQTKKY